MINKETKIIINNKTYTVQEFMAKYAVKDESTALMIIDKLVAQGKATIKDESTKEEKLIQDTLKAIEKDAIVEGLDIEAEENRIAKREKAKAEVDLTNVSLAFNSTPEAEDFRQWCYENGINDTEISERNGELTLKIYEVTPNEYVKITRKYNTEKAIKSTVNATSSVCEKATKGIDFGLTKVVAPAARIGAEAGMNIGKAVVHTGIKTGAGLINSGSKAVKQTADELRHDPELLRAGKELRDAKNKMKSFFSRKFGGKSTGISTF